jgi:hypothetical protein
MPLFKPKSKNLVPAAAQLSERLPRTLRRHRFMKAWMAFTGEDPLQLVRIREQFFGYADMRDGFMRLIVIEGDFEREFFPMANALLEQGSSELWMHSATRFVFARSSSSPRTKSHLEEPDQMQ